MTSRLERMLEPGERVVYRDARSFVPLGWHYYLAVMALFSLALLVFDGHLRTLTIVGTMVVAMWIWNEVAVYAVETVLTDRRILRKTGWRQVEITGFPLAVVKTVSYRPTCYPGMVRLRKSNGGTEEFYGLRRPQAFAAVLADAAGVARPPLIGRLIEMMPYLCVFGGLPCAALLGWGLYELAQVTLPTWLLEDEASQFLALLCAVPVLAVGCFFGVHLVGLLGFAVLRPFVTFEEARNAICMESEGKLARRIDRMTDPLFIWWTGLLYGRQVRCEDCMEERHG